MKKMRKIWRGLCIFTLLFSLVVHPENVKADEASVTFGSESYESEANSEFWIGVYIKGDSRVGAYHIEMEYDHHRLEYIGGAESGENGKIVLEGTGTREQIRYMISFKSISGGEADIKITDAVIYMGTDEDAESFEITELDEAVVTIAGRDTVGDIADDEPGFETDVPHIEPAVLLGEKEYYLLDLTQQIPENIGWTYDIVTLDFSEQEVFFLTNETRSIYFTYLFDETEKFVCYAYNPGSNMFYPCSEYKVDGKTYYYTSPDACEQWPADLSLDIIKEQGIVYAIDEQGNGQFSRLDAEGNLVEWDATSAKQSADKQNSKLMWILVIAIVVIIIIFAGLSITARELGRKKRIQKKQEQRKIVKERAVMARKEIADLSQATIKIPSLENATTQSAVEVKEKEVDVMSPAGAPVIEVKDVTMRFKIATSNVSGIKEYFIQLLKKQISYRELLALDHVSFNVYKGEVVGIIGTNGSGKSTLLRIVSGALKPTEGKVRVNRKKLQLLTLGTGFDMELTAKENVYLNGAIIGYTEEFINEHYDEIVKFAELEGFMEEKVKNFSSGMVSRLGFAIATVGEASEILILDEVLSVGDEFFRKKSLARIKEMIHGGSTVLMVSHGMDTITEHCSKVVWIEKGKLKMVGTPQKVCGAYQKQFESN